MAGGRGGGGDFAGLNGDRSGYSFNAENVSNFMWLLGFGNGYYRPRGGGGGGGVTLHMTSYAPVSGGVRTHPKFRFPNLNPVPSFSCHDDVKLIWNFDSKILDISWMK